MTSKDTGMDTLIGTARSILRANDRGGYAVPTDRLYPFQWNWDSGFVAMGWATFDEPRAWSEIAFLLKGQWEDGMIPQIIFHAPSDDYFPGPDVWGIHRTPPTSGITQPPILAAAVRHMLDTASDRDAAEAQVAGMFAKLLAHHRWWAQARDPESRGLVATLHPWETGMDNSPAWDVALARVPTGTRTEIKRRDTAHIDASMRPRGEEYQRFIHLVDLFRDCGWDPAKMYAASPFRVADVGINAILLRAERDLLVLAERFGSEADRAEIATRIDRLSAGLARLWSDAHGLFLSYDLIPHSLIPRATSAGFLPLFGGAATDAQATTMAATLQRWRAQAPWMVASSEPGTGVFEPMRYWRGPAWAVVNWMIARGFAAHGHGALTAAIDDQTNAMIAQAGFSEYFDSTTGQGIGGAVFSWTAAIFLMLEQQKSAALGVAAS